MRKFVVVMGVILTLSGCATPLKVKTTYNAFDGNASVLDFKNDLLFESSSDQVFSCNSHGEASFTLEPYSYELLGTPRTSVSVKFKTRDGANITLSGLVLMDYRTAHFDLTSEANRLALIELIKHTGIFPLRILTRDVKFDGQIRITSEKQTKLNELFYACDMPPIYNKKYSIERNAQQPNGQVENYYD